jgi:hypothetical protein
MYKYKNEREKLGKKKFFGFIEYRPKWSLTLKGWGILLAITIVSLSFVLANIQPFLAVSKPVPNANVLVVEGWIDDEPIQGALAEFKKGNYQFLVTTGIPLARGYHLSEYKNFAELCAAIMISYGFDRSKLIAVPTPKTRTERTLASAIAFGKWLSQSKLPVKSINIYSENAHTRRSWLMYRRVLPPNVEVGSIAHPAISYNANKWWISSEGVRMVLSEAIAFVYANFVNWK